MLASLYLGSGFNTSIGRPGGKNDEGEADVSITRHNKQTWASAQPQCVDVTSMGKGFELTRFNECHIS